MDVRRAGFLPHVPHVPQCELRKSCWPQQCAVADGSQEMRVNSGSPGAKRSGLGPRPFCMVHNQRRLDRTFAALVDPTRRAILAHLERTAGASVTELAE